MDLEEALAQADTYSADLEEVCMIDNDLRTITIPSGLQTVGVESDEDVMRLNFQMPKQYHELDLSEFNIRINFLNANNRGDVYAVTDKAVSGGNITFSWLIGRNATAYRGNIRFIVCLKKTDAEGVVQQEFNTTLAQLTVLEGLETTEQVIQENPDIIEQILVRLDDLEENGGGGGTTNYNNLSNQPQINGVTLSGNKTSEDLHLQPAGRYITEETDPTVPDWAKEPEKPTYTASEVGALPSSTKIPTKLSEMENDSGYAKTADIPDKLPNPQKLTFTGAVTAEYDGSGAVTVTIPEGSGGSGGTARIEKLSTDTTVELEPNKLYIFPEMAELTLALAEPTDTGIVNEYHVVFQSGATATTLTLPDTVKLPSGFSIDANKVYEISILEGCLCCQSWEVS